MACLIAKNEYGAVHGLLTKYNTCYRCRTINAVAERYGIMHHENRSRGRNLNHRRPPVPQSDEKSAMVLLLESPEFFELLQA